MTPVNHAAAALVIRKFRPNTPLWPLLLATQLFDFIWVLLNFSGVEQTDTNDPVLAINDIHFTYMPLSHSIVSTLIVAVAVWLIFSRLGKPSLGIAIAAAIASHLVLDVLVHLPDIAITPFADLGRIGTGLYGFPVAAFVFECAFAIGCWWYYRGTLSLLVVMLILNALTVTIFVPSLHGPEAIFAGSPLLFVGCVAIAMAFSVVLVWWRGRSP